MARLLRAEQVAGAADLEVAHRDREAGAELGVVGERREPCARLGRQLTRLRIEEVGVRELVAAADAPADLVELREPELVGALDDQRVRLRDVEPRLDDRRRDEHVGVAGEELQHLVLELALRHLAVRDEEAEVRAELLQLLRGLLDRLDAVVQILQSRRACCRKPAPCASHARGTSSGSRATAPVEPSSRAIILGLYGPAEASSLARCSHLYDLGTREISPGGRFGLWLGWPTALRTVCAHPGHRPR